MSGVSTVHLVAGDGQSPDALSTALRHWDVRVRCFPSAEEFFSNQHHGAPGCVVVDTTGRSPDAVHFLQRMRSAGNLSPVVIVTGDPCPGHAVEAMRHGAVDYLVKPYETDKLRAAVLSALERDAERRSLRSFRRELAARYATLTPRERQVMEMIVAGEATKTIAYRLGTSHNTVQNQRARILKKMNARSVADVVRMAMLLYLDERAFSCGCFGSDTGKVFGRLVKGERHDPSEVPSVREAA